MSGSRLLKYAVPLVKSHGFTREALALSALSLPNPHPKPLSDSAVTALFGQGDEARRTLINAWLEQGKDEMIHSKGSSVGNVLKARLRWNESTLQYLPEAFALIASPSSGFPPVGVRPALRHAAIIADEACYVSGDLSTGTSWYTRRAALATVYTAAELHQLTSPETAYAFLDKLMGIAHSLESTIDEVGLFAQYVGRSWAGIIRYSGIL